MSKIYTVVQRNKNSFLIIDAGTGNTVGSIYHTGITISGPTVSGNTASIVIRKNEFDTKQYLYTYKLPSGNLLSSSII